MRGKIGLLTVEIILDSMMCSLCFIYWPDSPTSGLEGVSSDKVPTSISDCFHSSSG